MKKIISILILVLCGIVAKAQDYYASTNILATNVLALTGGAPLPVLTNYAWIDTHSYRYTSFVWSGRGSNSDTSGVLKLHALQTYDRYGTNYFTGTNLLLAVNINGNSTVTTNVTFGPDYFSGFRFCWYELSGTGIVTNGSLMVIQKGYLRDK